jgi:type I restriction enzyme R subunit
MDKRSLSEADICSKFITPALLSAGWNSETQIREQVHFTKGRIIVRGKLVSRGKSKFADYILYAKKNIPLAIVEAKDNNQTVGSGMQQALDYAEIVGVPFVFSSNGDGFLFHDKTGQSPQLETHLALDEFPSYGELWDKYSRWKGLTEDAQKVVLQDYHDDGSGKTPRYYQVSAVNAAMEAIAKGQDRLLLIMATGTGKTYTAFQIIWRLWKSKQKKRVLFLADRNVLVDQTMVNDFRPFGGAMAKLSPKSQTIERNDGTQVVVETAIDKSRRVDTSYEIYLGLYQALTGPEDRQKIFRDFSPEFFDLIVVDECHRGSADEESAWREILEYFSSATQIGMTATPKETKYASNIDYFGAPVYSYTLKQGIQDGFLAPYRVIKVHLDKDLEGYRPSSSDTDRDGLQIEDRVYNQRDFDRTIVLDERTKLVAKKVTQFLSESGDPFQKTIVFCVDEEHASRMREALVNENQQECIKDSRYVMRITGSDPLGKAQLGNFIDPESRYPVIVTTSKLLSTGVDVQTCRLIVLDREVGSMTEFKQIIGRGTRIHEDSKKFTFSIMDFRKATNNFADPEFDGEPVSIFETSQSGPVYPPEDFDSTTIPSGSDGDEVIVDDGQGHMPEATEKRNKIFVDGVAVTVLAQRVEYLDANGKLVTETLRDYGRKSLLRHFGSSSEFIELWNSAARKREIIENLESEGLLLEALQSELGSEMDPFDLILHVAFDAPVQTRAQRAAKVEGSDLFTKYGEKARNVLRVLLDKYMNDGELDLADARILTIPPVNHLGTPLEIVRWFGNKSEFEQAVHELQNAIYEKVA